MTVSDYESPDLKKHHLDEDQARVIVTLSEKLHLPAHEVQQVFLQELGRLESHARIRHFVGVLALRNTRSILRSGGGATSGS